MKSRCKRGFKWDGFVFEFVDETLVCQKGCLAGDGKSKGAFSDRSALVAHYRLRCPGMREKFSSVEVGARALGVGVGASRAEVGALEAGAELEDDGMNVGAGFGSGESVNADSVDIIEESGAEQADSKIVMNLIKDSVENGGPVPVGDINDKAIVSESPIEGKVAVSEPLINDKTRARNGPNQLEVNTHLCKDLI